MAHFFKIRYMNIQDFKVERYFAKYEFTAKYMLSSSDCDGYSMKYVLDQASKNELELWNNLKLGYTETRGSVFLREAIVKHYKTITKEEVLVASPGECNFIIMNILLQKGDELICMSPMYQSLYQVAKDIGAKLSFWKPKIENGEWIYLISELKKLITSKTKLLIVNFPHNPTGYSPEMSEYMELVELAREKGIYIFSDEMYRFLNLNEKYKLPSISDVYENGISLWGTSKTFGLAGLRIGWLTSKNKNILNKVEKFKDYLSICSSSTSEILSTIALNSMDKFLIPNLNKIKRNIELFSNFQKQNENLFDFYLPRSGSTAFIKLKLKESTSEFADKLVKETGIMLLPAETFEYGDSHLRIGFGREIMPEMLNIFQNYISKTYR